MKGDSSSRTSKARARWAILRQAILAASRDEAGNGNEHHAQAGSIHEFPGFQRVKRDHVPPSLREKILSGLQSQWREHILSLSLDFGEVNGDISFDRLMPQAIRLAVEAIQGSNASFQTEKIVWVSKLCESTSTGSQPYLSSEKSILLREQGWTLALEIVEATEGSSGNQQVSMRCSYDPSEQPVDPRRFHCQWYKLDESVGLIVREPLSTASALSLQDLISHRTQKVDNTGNVCVWDSEQTLADLLYEPATHTLLVPRSSSSAMQILELGSGMAGLSALACGLRMAQQFAAEEFPIKIDITDGHPTAVQSNRVHYELTSAAASSSDEVVSSQIWKRLEVSYRVLLWSTDAIYEYQQAYPEDYLLICVSDCTHFTNYHAALAVTLLAHLQVGGRALLCQPPRGTSLDRFLSILTMMTCVKVQHWKHPRMPVCVDAHGFDPDRHLPQLWIVEKVRAVSKAELENLVIAASS